MWLVKALHTNILWLLSSSVFFGPSLPWAIVFWLISGGSLQRSMQLK